MSQHDYLIADASGSAFLADLNLAVKALAENNYGTTEPAVMYAHMWWADTTANILKQRNAANTGWLSRYTLSTGALLNLALGTPASGVLTNCTGTAAGLTAGLASLASNLTGTPAFFAPITNSLVANVSLSAGSFVDGPSVAQGVTGKWFASGTITCQAIGGVDLFNVKLWDGTTVISSTVMTNVAQNFSTSISLSGYMLSPAGNLRMSVEAGRTGSLIRYSASTGGSKDSTITAIRIG